ncbi:lamin tail domain-containing protein [Rubrivirga sp. IMCC45206]|uniref:lamin tail domain-containing protein n=1 Tax=Rubrivirga sp. IMCC45206 TaxID=3391614 RepID=UPI00398FEC12
MRVSPPLPRLSIGLVLLATALTLAGCEDSVDPTVGLDAPFSVYGYLDPTADRQAIRVAPITDLLDDSTSVVASVTSTDLSTGAITPWRDSVVTFPGNRTGHVFVADLTPTPETTVRIEARRADGAASTVDVAVPPLVQPAVVSARGVGGSVVYRVAFEGAPRVLNGQLRLTVSGLPGLAPGETGVVVVTEGVQPTEAAPGEWVADVPFAAAVRRALETQGHLDRRLRLLAAEYVGFVTNAAWALPTRDPDALAEPGLFSNVDGGLGFIGAGYRASTAWMPQAAVQIAAGLAAPADGLFGVVINEVLAGGPASWVELYNPTVTPTDLSGYSLSDERERPEKVQLGGTVLAPGQFVVVPFPDPIARGDTVALYGRVQERIAMLRTERLTDGVSVGAFPDGAPRHAMPDGADLFRGPLRPTPGLPNEFGLEVAVVNEVFTEGADGFVEVVRVGDGHEAEAPIVFDTLPLFSLGVAASGLDLGVAAETPGRLALAQIGGTLYLAVRYRDRRIAKAPFRTRVVDVRPYGPQVPGRSVGYFPDPLDPWTPGLRPTRGAPNASARLGM